MKSTIIRIATTIFLFLVQSAIGHAQLSITGPTCVIAGTEYQYDVPRIQLTAINMQVCIAGGVIAGTDSSCRNGQPFSYIRVIWNNTAQGEVSINTPKGNASIKVIKTTELQGGRMLSLSPFQVIKKDSTPTVIVCSKAIGGSCSPSYKYQWQQSSDGVKWLDLVGAGSQNLLFVSPVAKTTYYRRKVTESLSGSENFSDVAALIIDVTTSRTP